MSSLYKLLILLAFLLAQGHLYASDSGWTTVTPAKDAQIIYVSSSTGRDFLGKVYKASEISDLENPGQIRAFKSLRLAASKMRKGHPDILLLKRGDEWTLEKGLWPGGGRSADAKMTFMAYGAGKQRPKISSSDTVFRIWGKAHNVAIIGLYLYAHQRDPDSEYFAGWAAIGNPSGISIYDEETTMSSYLIEDNRINFFDGAISITGKARHEDIVIRRNLIQNSYDVGGHSQGIYARLASVLLEENILDHNGWYQQKLVGKGGSGQGQATIFNHNTYFVNSYDTVFRNNLFLRASSQNNKWTANPSGKVDSIESQNVRIENNFYFAGEIGIGIGGNKDNNTGFRWQNIEIRDNVILATGRDQPTRRNIAWNLIAKDWNGGVICGNYLLHNGNPAVDNLLGISVQGHTADLQIMRNTITGLRSERSNRAGINFDNYPKTGISVSENRIQLPNSKMRMIDSGRSFEGRFSKNVYYGAASPAEWFMRNETRHDFAGWQAASGDQASSLEQIKFPDASRDLGSYIALLGFAGEDEFFEKLAQQSRFNWDPRLTAQSVNAFLREGYGNLTCAAR